MIFYNISHPSDKDFTDENNQIRLGFWKTYWRYREQDPETRREIRIDKAQTKKRIHQKDRRTTKRKLNNMKDHYKNN